MNLEKMDELCQSFGSVMRAEDSGVFMSASTTECSPVAESYDDHRSVDGTADIASGNITREITAEQPGDEMNNTSALDGTPSSQSQLNIISEMEEDASSSNHGDQIIDKKREMYNVIYMGYSVLDRRYTQTVMPWVMAEVKRRKEFREVQLEIMSHTLRGTACDRGTESMLFDHRLHSLTRFARTYHDPCCFGYLTRQQLYNNFQCHVFLAPKEELVPELFKAIRDATQESVNKRPGSGELWEDLGEEDQCAATAFYEVLYIGRVRVHGEKITSHYIDDLVDRFETKDLDFPNTNTSASGDEGNGRNRHASGASVKSLPATLDDSVSVTENELGQQREKFKYPDGESGGSRGSSVDDIMGTADMVDSSTENILEGEHIHTCHIQHSTASAKSDSQDSLDGARSVSNPYTCTTDMSGGAPSMNGNGPHHAPLPMYTKAERNRTMLFRLSVNDITLISPDLKSPMLERKFKDIPSVSQGSKKQDVFGFISREAHHVFVCHLLRCHSKDVVDDVMTGLRVAFTSAYEQNKLQICTMCPLHQLHKLCQELEGVKVAAVSRPREDSEDSDSDEDAGPTEISVDITGGSIHDIKNGSFRLIYGHPEAFLSSQLGKNIIDDQTFRESVLAVVYDEAHCALEWGEDFRTDYGKLHTLGAFFPQCSTLCTNSHPEPHRRKTTECEIGTVQFSNCTCPSR